MGSARDQDVFRRGEAPCRLRPAGTALRDTAPACAGSAGAGNEEQRNARAPPEEDLTSVRTRHRVPGGHSQLPLVPPPRPRPVRCPRVPIVVLAVPPHTPGVRSRREPPKRRNLSRRVLAPPGAAVVSRSRGASPCSPAGQAVQRPPSPVYTSDIRKDSLDDSNSSCSQALHGYRRSIGLGDVMLVGRDEGSEVGGSEKGFRGVARVGHDRNLTRTSVRIKGSGPEVTLSSHLLQCFPGRAAENSARNRPSSCLRGAVGRARPVCGRCARRVCRG